MGFDKIGAVLSQVNDLLMLSKGKTPIGAKIGGTSAVKTTVTTTEPVRSNSNTDSELDGDAGKILTAMENIKAVSGDDIATDLEAIGRFAAENPDQYLQYITMLKNRNG